MTEPAQHAEYVPLTIKQEVRSLGWIMERVQRLSPAGKLWLRDWLIAHTDGPVAGERLEP